jgi:hypothetical protein
MVYTFEEHDYDLYIWGTQLCSTHLRNMTMFYTFEEHDYGLHIWWTGIPQMYKR